MMPVIHKTTRGDFAGPAMMRVTTLMRDAAKAIGDTEALRIIDEMEEAMRDGNAEGRQQLMAELELHARKGKGIDTPAIPEQG